MKLFKVSSTILILLFTLISCGQDATDEQTKTAVIQSDHHNNPTDSAKNMTAMKASKAPGANIIAYSMGNDIEQVKKYPLDKLTHIIYSFLHLKGNKLEFDNPQSQQMVRSLVALKKQYPHLKILVALGGWGGCETCSDVFADETGQKEFIASVQNIMQTYQLDGLDLDWEYPVVEGFPGHPRSPQDKNSFSTLVKGLRQGLGEQALITFAAGGYNEYLEQAIDWSAVMPYIDWVNLMSYDLVNGYSTVTGHHTPLYSAEKQIESTNNAVEYLLQAKVPPSKIVIGAAFYARVWQNVAEENNGLFQDESKFLTSVDYAKLDEYFAENNFSRYWDDASQAPYAYSAEKQWFATFDDVKSLAVKTDYVKKLGLNGIMFWQLGGDKTEAGLVDTIYSNLVTQ